MIPENVLKDTRFSNKTSDSPGQNVYGNSLNDNVIKKNLAKGSSQGKQTSFSLFGNTNSVDLASGPTLLKPLATPSYQRFGHIRNNKIGQNKLRTSINGL